MAETEFQRNTRLAEHDALWTPQQRHTGPWVVDQSKTTGRVDVTPRKVKA